LGVGLGVVRYFDLTEDETVVEEPAEARHISSTFAKQGSWGSPINLFWVASLAWASGFSGGIPGVPGVYDQPGSGIILDANRSAVALGGLAAHEMGHFAGLWHTSDFNGRADVISDTEVCADPSQNDCPDRRNLMFPVVPTSGLLELTPGQVGVARRSPFFYEVAYPDVCGPGVPAVDLTQSGFASGNTATSGDSGAGFCGGAEQPDRVHLVRLGEGVGALQIEARSDEFTPVLYVQHQVCGSEEVELACAPGAAASVKLTIDQPGPGAYFVFVDGLDGAGRYTLTVNEVAAQSEQPQ